MSNNVMIIGIAGGTGSGKSTFTNRLRDAFPDDVAVLYHDNYYKCQDDVPFEERKKVNYDHPDSLETDLMIQHLEALKNGIAVDCPVYDYSMHNRSDKTIHIEPKKIILAEGILLLEDPRLRNMMDIKIYVEADADERILRRIVRDVKERGRDLDNIVEQYLTTVKPMHYLYVEPTRALADVVINSGMNDVAFDIVRSKIQLMLEGRIKKSFALRWYNVKRTTFFIQFSLAITGGTIIGLCPNDAVISAISNEILSNKFLKTKSPLIPNSSAALISCQLISSFTFSSNFNKAPNEILNSNIPSGANFNVLVKISFTPSASFTSTLILSIQFNSLSTAEVSIIL